MFSITRSLQKIPKIIPPRIVLSVCKETISTLKKVRFKVPLNFVKGLSSLEWFSFECRKTKTTVITLANHIGHRQDIEPIKTRSNYMWAQLTLSSALKMPLF